MTELNRKKVAAVVPALNEEKNVGNVLKVLLDSNFLDEVILVDDGSTDRTAEIGEKLGAKVIKLPKIGGSGKGNAMKHGVEATNADIIVFFDADLVGLKEKYISLLAEPMLRENIEMCIGVRGRLFGFPWLIIKIDPIMAIGGERAVRRELFERIPNIMLQGFMVEPALNYYCLIKKLSVQYVILKDLRIIIKEEKWGILKGLISRFKMIKQITKIRLKFIFNKNEFV